MPLTKKGKKIKRAMRKHYKSKRKGDEVFYASQNKGTIKGTHKGKKKRGKGKRRRASKLRRVRST